MSDNDFRHHRYVPTRELGHEGWRSRILIVLVRVEAQQMCSRAATSFFRCSSDCAAYRRPFLWRLTLSSCNIRPQIGQRLLASAGYRFRGTIVARCRRRVAGE